MSKYRNDISQIKKYVSGELDARAMHRLERQALDDPFLADALEGYQHAGSGQQANLADLSARLQERIEPKIKRLIPWRPLSIAASILVIIGVGIWLMTRNQVETTRTVADNIKPFKKSDQQPVIASPSASLSKSVPDSAKPDYSTAKNKELTPGNPSAASSPPALAEIRIPQPQINQEQSQPIGSTTKADTALFSRGVPTANGSQNLLSTNANKAVADKSSTNGYLNQAVVTAPNATYKSTQQNADVFKKVPSNQPTLLQSKVDGVDVKPQNKTLSGTVTGLNGTPLAGAVVKMAGTNFGVVTDENGRFVIHDAPEKNNLTVGYIGYDSKQIKLNDGDSVNIALTPTRNQLDETTVGSMASKKSTDAHPSAGWKALDNYLSKNAVSPDGQTGKVYLSFTVDGQGNLNNFTVLKSLSTAADQKAIDLLTKGPGWAGAADGQTHEVKVTVEFK